MLVRIRGGEAGIKEYLERGRKGGRDYDRAELDERVVLAGDLELTDAIVKGMSKEGERYLHVTLSFKEDEVSRETLQAITDEFRAFAFAAFDADEYNFYSEAHLPKIKSYEDRQSGEFIERKPHIHIVIPETNLLTGQGLNPFGRVEHQIKFLEAWQEAVNDRYGLASPKDHRRVEFTDESTIIARHQGDVFAGAHRELKSRLLADVLERGVTDFAEFGALVAEHGTTRTRNAGKSGAYLNVKLEGERKGINLKEWVFSREFIALPADEKRRALAAELRQYEEQKAPRPTAADIEGRLTEWREVRSAEVKYLNSGNRREYAEYRAADSEQRRAILGQKAVKFYAKGRAERTEQEPPARVGAAIGIIPKPPVAAIGREPPPAARGRLRTLAELPTLQMEAAPAVAAEVRPRPELRPAAVRDGRDGRDADNVVGQLAAEHRAEVARSRSPGRAEIDRIKRELDAAQLLEVLDRTHGAIRDKYAVTQGKDGSERIAVGKRNLNVSDFLTAELHLPWVEAEQILRETYAEQQRRQDRPAPVATAAPGQTEAPATTPRPIPRRDLWEAYQAQRADQTAHTWTEQRQREHARRAEARRVYKAERRALQDRTRPAAERKAARSVLAAAKVAADQELWEQTRAERAEIRAAMRPAEAFRAFLAARADQGDAEALAELRRQRRREPDQAGERIEGRELRPEAPPIAAPRYRVDQAGNVTYYDARDRAMFVDQGARVRFEAQNREALETGLKLAVVKFGPNLSLQGSDEYKAAMIEIAADSGLRITFDDPESQVRYIERREAMRLGREYIDQAGARPAAVEPTQAQSKQQEPPARVPEALGAAKVQEAATEAPTRRDLERQARDLAPTTRPEPKGKGEEGPAPTQPAHRRRHGHSR